MESGVTPWKTPRHNNNSKDLDGSPLDSFPSGKRLKSVAMAFMGVVAFLFSCTESKEHTAPAIHDRDSVSIMTSYGVNTLISDSGVIKYKIVTERWDINQTRVPSRWTFEKGIFLEQFDEKFHVQAYIQADTAWYYDTKKLWELRGRVRVRNVDGLVFNSEELYWDGMTHEFYSNKFSRVITPERTLQGTYFRSDEHMTRYTVSNSKGSFVKSDMDGSPATTSQTDTVADTTANVQRPKATPHKAPQGAAPIGTVSPQNKKP